MFDLSMINATTLLCFAVKGTLCAPWEYCDSVSSLHD